ncbi:MAG: tetratricopeptide repeat protein, partial [Bacteroidia bacterium]|nr:tetratricopeptide repeat protein [Bacteroidia bacterium]
MSGIYKLTFTILLLLFMVTSSSAQTKKAYVKAANEAMESNNISSAAAYYSSAVRLDDSDIELHFKAAECYQKINNYSSATKHFEKVINSERISQFKEAYYHLGDLTKLTGNYEEAKVLFEKYLELDNDSASIFHQKANIQLKSVNWALDQLYPNGLKVQWLEGKINTEYTEFAPFLINDSIIYYSSLSFEGKNMKEGIPTPTISKILRSMDGSRGWRSGRPLKPTFNRTNSHNCNATLSGDGKLMLFTRCNYNSKNELECKLYESALVNGKWQSPRKVDSKLNKRGFTSTHPAIANAGAEGYIIYFVSDKPNGLGGLDIWQSKRNAMGAYTEPVNLGPTINTIFDEITPYYHNNSQTLYFSSQAHVGFGGFDIFKSKATNFTYYQVENVGSLINSTFNDQYAVLNASGSKVIFSSNRPTLENQLMNFICCYDLFSFQFSDTIQEVNVDTTLVVEIDTTTNAEEFEIFSSFAPIKLFFHNDEPDSNTWNTETEKTYLETYDSYIKMQNEYELE